jgi:nucleoid-associated protein Lsr2
MNKMNKRFGKLEEFVFEEPLSNSKPSFILVVSRLSLTKFLQATASDTVLRLNCHYDDSSLASYDLSIQHTPGEEGTTMATKVLRTLQDDIDGSDATQTIRFALDGIEYEIDVSDRNANRLRNSLSDFIAHGRKVGGTRGRKPTSSGQVDTKAVRKWAEANRIEVSSRGRIPADVVERYRAAGN